MRSDERKPNKCFRLMLEVNIWLMITHSDHLHQTLYIAIRLQKELAVCTIALFKLLKLMWLTAIILISDVRVVSVSCFPSKQWV